MSVVPAEPEIGNVKTVYFIRHGESEYNAFKSRKSTWFTCRCWCCCDPQFFDPRLSAKGAQQVEELKAEVDRKSLHTSVELVYVSPLTRAIETCCGTFIAPSRPPIIVTELISEVMDTTGDIGRHPAELSKEFVDLSFEKLPEAWWFHDPERGPLTAIKEPASYLKQRQDRFLAELASRPEQTIAVVGHSAFIKSITSSSSKLPNCGVMKATFNVTTQRISHKEVIYQGKKP